MVHDWGSRDANFMPSTDVLDRIAALAGAQGTHVAVPMQGSGTFAVEAMLTSFVPRDGKVLLLVNGAYGQRAQKIAEIAGRALVVLETPEDTPPDLAALEALLAADPAITHVFAVHCETTSGILNPLAEIAALVARHGRRLLVDSMSAFGALPSMPARSPSTRSPPRATSASKACRASASSSAAARRSPRARATPPRWCSTCTTSGEDFEKTGQ